MVNLSPIEYSWHRKYASINETVILGPAYSRGRDPPNCRFARESRGARSQPVYEAVQEVAPPHARPRGRSARIGSFCRVVAAWVQACVGAVGRVRNASPIREDPVFSIAGFTPAFCDNFAKASRPSQRILRQRRPASVLRSN